MKKYIKKINIPYYDVDKNGLVTAISILKYLNEVSAEHNDIVVDVDKMEEDGLGWMLNKWKINIERYPKVYENIRIETWISNIKRFFVFREFKVVDKNNNILAYGTAEWIFMNLDKRIPVRLNKEYKNKIEIIENCYFKKFTRFKKDLNLQLVRKYIVRRFDIDLNNHVNNINYLIWMLESVEDEIYDNYKLDSFEIDYKNEVKYPSNISVWKRNIDNKEKIKIIHGIYSEDGKVDKALGITEWSKKNK